MKISTSLLGRTAYYVDTFFDKAAHEICSFGKVDGITVSATDNVNYLTIVDNKGRTTNFATKEMIKTWNLNAFDINQLHFTNH